jgi:hypothetical protein
VEAFFELKTSLLKKGSQIGELARFAIGTEGFSLREWKKGVLLTTAIRQ